MSKIVSIEGQGGSFEVSRVLYHVKCGWKLTCAYHVDKSAVIKVYYCILRSLKPLHCFSLILVLFEILATWFLATHPLCPWVAKLFNQQWANVLHHCMGLNWLKVHGIFSVYSSVKLPPFAWIVIKIVVHTAKFVAYHIGVPLGWVGDFPLVVSIP